MEHVDTESLLDDNANAQTSHTSVKGADTRSISVVAAPALAVVA